MSYPPDHDLAKRVRRSRDLVLPFATAQLEDGESIVALLSIAFGPLPPWTPLVPVFGILAIFTRLLRAHAVVVTDRRVLLIRRGKTRPGRPQRVDVSVHRDEVRVLEWRAGTPYSTLVIEAAGRRFRLTTHGPFAPEARTVVDSVS